MQLARMAMCILADTKPISINVTGINVKLIVNKNTATQSVSVCCQISCACIIPESLWLKGDMWSQFGSLGTVCHHYYCEHTVNFAKHLMSFMIYYQSTIPCSSPFQYSIPLFIHSLAQQAFWNIICYSGLLKTHSGMYRHSRIPKPPKSHYRNS